jgi:sugar phosphate isomerase/epimerase
MKDFRFGCSTWFFQELSVSEALRTIERIGFSAAEIWMEHLWKSPESLDDIRRLAGDLGIALSLHAASYDVNIASSNPGIHRESLRQIEESLRAAAELGAGPVVVHAGRLSSSKGDMGEYWRMLSEAFDFLQRAAAECDAQIAIEVMEKRPKERFVAPEDVQRMMESKRPNLGLTLDLAHIQTVMNHEQFFHRIQKEWIFHVHLSDYSPASTHVPLGRGSMDIDGALLALSSHYRGVVIVEGYVPGAGLQTLESNRGYLRDHGWM